jgi:two-component system nitrogen regulation response regulator GlnG
VSGGTDRRLSSIRETDQVLRQWVREAIAASEDGSKFDSLMDHVAGILVGEALTMTRGNRSQAARLLGLSRPTLHSKIEKYRLRLKTSVEDEPPDHGKGQKPKERL